MPKVKIFNSLGKEVGEKDLRGDIFGVKISPALIHEVVVGIMANERRPYAHTKTRGEVRGGGKKPWKQKGTGRARQGSIRSPLWVGGGITFGPRSDRDYSIKINRKTRKQALLMSLSDKVAQSRLVLVESFGIKDGKTKEMVAVLNKLPIAAKKKTVLISGGPDNLLRRGTSNLQEVTLRNVGDFSLLDVLRSEYLLMTPEVAESIEKKYAAPAAA